MRLNIKLLVPAGVVCLMFSGCIEEFGYYDDRASYHGGGQVDFYYTSGRPYSRTYGPLYMRDNRYYYSRGGTYVVYDRPTRVYSDTRVVRRDVDIDRGDRDRSGYDRSGYDRSGYDRRTYDRGGYTPRTYDRRDYDDRDSYGYRREDVRSSNVIVTEPRRSGQRVIISR